MRIVLSIIGLVSAFYLIRYRERIGDMIGDADWMHKIGGVYNLVILVAAFIFFWSIAELTGTTDILFGPIKYILPGLPQQPPPAF